MDKDAEKRLGEYREQKRQLERLAADPAWLLVVGTVKQQIMALRMMDFNAPIETLDAAVSSAATRGRIAGLQMLVAIRESLIDNLAVDIEHLVQEEEET